MQPTSKRSESLDLTSLKEWILSDRSSLSSEELLAGVCEVLVGRGVQIWRCSTSLLTLHPEVFVRNIVWDRESGCQSNLRSHDITLDADYLKSPVAAIHRGVDRIRRNLNEIDLASVEFPVLVALAKQGATDYLALSLPFRNGRRSFISFATCKSNGFSEHEIAQLESLQSILALRFELESSYFATKCLLEVYLGKNASRRVMDGAFKRGSGESISAAVFTCDLRGFTALSESIPVDQLVGILDKYFECVAGPIAKYGGEVMKFIGDAILAIFPHENDQQGACQAALAAAEEALANIDASSTSAGQSRPLSIGIGLHVGDVFYGNIGAANRLDFTVIGPTVNEVCRLESLCKDFAVPLIVSAKFSNTLPGDRLKSLGHRDLKGVKEQREVFTLASFRATTTS